MRALLYRRSVPRYVAARLLGSRAPSLLLSIAPTVRMEDTPEPKLPTPQWVRIRPLMTGVCGSDVAVITGEGTPYLSALVSFPFVPGHEVVGVVTEVGSDARGVSVGQRVVVEPALGCTVRGFLEKCAPCQAGNYANCERALEGDISAGIQTGFCRDTAGGWGPNLVAHRSQVYPVAPGVPDQAAVLAEPLSCAIHGVLRTPIDRGSTVLVLGCGTIGLLTIAALRAFAPACTIVAVARYPHQQRFAGEFGADHVIRGGDERLQELTKAKVIKLPLGKPHVLGGVDTTFVCTGSASAWEDALRWTRSHGPVVMVGMPGLARADLTPFWYKELRVVGAYAYGSEGLAEGKSTFSLALDMLGRQGWSEKLAPLVTHRFPLEQHKQAFLTAMEVGKHGAVKVAFDMRDGA